MAVKKAEQKEFIVILDKNKSAVVAFVNPAKGYDMDDIVDSLVAKGLNAEIRETSDEVKKVEL